MIQEDYITLDEARKAHSLGLTIEDASELYLEDGSVFPTAVGKFSKFNKYPRPTLNCILKWLRKYQQIIVELSVYGDLNSGWIFSIYKQYIDKLTPIYHCKDVFDDYEQAAHAALDYTLTYLLYKQEQQSAL